jgi:hypothetical protein
MQSEKRSTVIGHSTADDLNDAFSMQAAHVTRLTPLF